MNDDDRELSTDDATAALSAAFSRKMREIDDRSRRVNGKIKKILTDKGFGFITDENGIDRFFHKDECLANFEGLAEGDPVTFIAQENPKKGPRAQAVDIAVVATS